MNIANEIKMIRELLGLSQQELADELEVSFQTVNRWETSSNEIEQRNIDKLYEYAYNKGIQINKIKEMFLIDENNYDDNVLLFHGAKKKFSLPVDLSHSKDQNDFGRGFYLGENLEQASTYISNSDYPYVYSFCIDCKGVKIERFSVSKDWMIAIAYFRGWLNEYSECTLIKEIITRVNNADLVIAPIADNRMFDILSEFVDGSITDLQCQHALAATNLGFQYVLKSEKAISKLVYISDLYLCKSEKKDILNKRLEMHNLTAGKVRMARIEYKGKGNYIEEILK
jgi:transcriptional regulator with XRE-family HTH domain